MTYLITTRAIVKTCRCGHPILAGLAEGLPARVDIRPLTAPEEIAALLDGRWTFAFTRWGELVHRDEYRIRAGYVGESIHAQHRCPPAYHQPTLTGSPR